MTELETIQRAKLYIDKMSRGINPLDDTPVQDGDILQQQRISRCLTYVSGILAKVIEKEIAAQRRKSARSSFFLTMEQRERFVFSDQPIPATDIIHQLNELSNPDVCKKLTYRQFTAWLIGIGALQIMESSDGKSIKRPTDQGRELGIVTEKRIGESGEYTVVVYTREAQQLILDNLDAMTEQ